jgi:Tfp pilus assembly protein FimV
MLVPQLSRAITSRRESARRRAEAFAAAQRELEDLRARVEKQAAELRARDEELVRRQEQIRSLEQQVESLRNGAGPHDQITSLLASEGAGEGSAPAGDVAHHLAAQDDRELAEIFDTALRTWAIRDRLGAYEEAEDWRRLALATVHEASTRPSFNGDGGGGKRRLRGGPMRQLAEACAAHRLRA